MAKTLSQFDAEQSDLVRELKAQLDEKDRILDLWRKEHGKDEVFVNLLLASVSAIKPQKKVYEPKEQEGATLIEAVTQDSDWHMGAIQQASEIEGFNEFSPEICRERVFDYTHRFSRLTDRLRLSYTINKCSIISTGDLISGDIHQELQVTNSFPVTVQIVEAARLLAERVSLLAQNFEVVEVHFVSADNHSRLTKKPQAKQEGLNSYNYLVGELAKAYLAKYIEQGDVVFNIYPVHEKIITVLNRNYLISHGHGVRSWMGRPWYGIERRVSKEAETRMELIMSGKLSPQEAGFHKFIFGHFHTPFDTVNFSCSGSVQGTDAYDHKNGRYAAPSQAAWFIHPKYAEFGRIDFQL